MNMGIHSSLDDGSWPRPWSSNAAMNHDAPSTLLHCGGWRSHIGMQYLIYLMLWVLPKQFSLSFISPQKILAAVVWSVKLLLCKLQVCSVFVFLLLESISFLYGVLPSAPCLVNLLRMVDSWTLMLTSVNEPFKLPVVTLGCFSTSLSILCCALRRQLLRRIATVLHHLHLWTVFDMTL